MRTKKRSDFWIGAVFAWCFESLRQDFYGMERYIEVVKAGWISSVYTIPLAIIGLIAVAFSMLYPEKDGKEK